MNFFSCVESRVAILPDMITCGLINCRPRLHNLHLDIGADAFYYIYSNNHIIIL